MNTALRRAELSDADSLSALATRTYSEAFGHSLRASDLSAHLRNNLSPERVRKMIGEDTLLLAYEKDKLIGGSTSATALRGSANKPSKWNPAKRRAWTLSWFALPKRTSVKRSQPTALGAAGELGF